MYMLRFLKFTFMFLDMSKNVKVFTSESSYFWCTLAIALADLTVLR